MKNINGFSLLEVLLTLTLSLFVCVLLFKLIINADHVWYVQQNQVATIEKALATKAILQQAITHAGYLGCQRASGDIEIIDHLHAYNNVRPWLRVTSDMLEVMYLSPGATPIFSEANSDAVLTDNRSSIKAGDIVVVSDCRHVEFVKVSRVGVLNQMKKIYFSGPLSFDYKGFSYVGELVVNQFTLKDTSRRDNHGNRIKSLYVRNTKGRNQEAVSEVNALFFSKHNDTVDVDLTFSQGDHYDFNVACKNC